PVAVGADHLGEPREHARGGADRVLVAAGAEDGEEDRFRIGRADARAVERVGNQTFDPPPQAAPVADHAVMHEQPAAAGEGVAVRARDRRAGRRAHMREIEVRVDVAAEVAQILVGPRRADLAIEPGLRVFPVPAHAEAVAVGGGGRFQRPLTLHHQRVGGGGDVLFQRNRFAAIGNPAAHRTFSPAPSDARHLSLRADAAKQWRRARLDMDLPGTPCHRLPAENGAKPASGMLAMSAMTQSARRGLARIERLFDALADPARRERTAVAVILGYVALWTL